MNQRRTALLAACATLLISVSCSPSNGGDPSLSESRVVALTYSEPKQTEFLKAVLASMNLTYTAEATPEGELVQWASTDLAQEQEIQDRVSQCWFIATQCKGKELPPPDKPAVSRLSC
jgi:hypothetical protein